MKILIVCALKEEYQERDLEPPFFPVLYTGIGKINAAINLMKEDPSRFDLIVNIGSCGSKTLAPQIVRCKSFTEWDLKAPKGFRSQEIIFENDFIKKIELPYKKVSCATGDSFVTDQNIESDVFDMEAFSLAKVAQVYNVPFLSIKYISDACDEKSWLDSLPEIENHLRSAIALILVQISF